MNYIRHLSAFYMKAAIDDRLKPTHISLYHALFQFWNMNRFTNPVKFNRRQVLNYCKIGSNHTLYRCLKELGQWGYIEYSPSHSPFKNSVVNLCIFDITQLKKNDLDTGAKSTQLGCKNDTTPGAKMHHLINNINIKTLSEENSHSKNSGNLDFSKKGKQKTNQDTGKAKRKKVAPKKENIFTAPFLDEVLTFFSEQKYPDKEARKFYFHFEANGWKVGGKTPMKNWTAAAHNWMLNTDKFNLIQKTNSLKLNNQKNYDEPL